LPQTEASHLHLALDVDPSLPAVVADRGRVEQVIVNLIHNAIKFTPAGGTITAGAEVEGEFLRVMVSDTGVGIEPEELPRLFERFYKADPSRRSQGTGLGLAIAKHIVLAHGGTIWAESQPQRGATFWFTLPLAPVETRSNGPIGGQSAGQEHLGVHRQAR
jgi:two-component system phosphate regulon sensor histidine kinase PhoR